MTFGTLYINGERDKETLGMIGSVIGMYVEVLLCCTDAAPLILTLFTRLARHFSPCLLSQWRDRTRI